MKNVISVTDLLLGKKRQVDDTSNSNDLKFPSAQPSPASFKSTTSKTNSHSFNKMLPTPQSVATPQMMTETTKAVILCNEIYDCFRAKEWPKILHKFEELKQTPEIHTDCPNQLEKIAVAWGRAMEAARQVGCDNDHLKEMMSDFIEFHGRPHQYLSVIVKSPKMSLYEVLDDIVSDYDELTGSAINGIFDKFNIKSVDIVEKLWEKVLALYNKPGDQMVFPSETPVDHSDQDDSYLDDANSPISIIASPFSTTYTPGESFPLTYPGEKEIDVNLPPFDVQERFTKFFLQKMKYENPEEVHQRMLDIKLYPVSVHTYNILFSKQDLETPIMNYYNEMIGFKITPEKPTLRFLANNANTPAEEVSNFKKRMNGIFSPTTQHMSLVKRFQYDSAPYDAEQWYKRFIVEGYEPDRPLFNHLISTCRRRPEKGDMWFDLMLDFKIVPNAVTFTNLITVWKDRRQGRVAEEYLFKMKEMGVTPQNHNYCALLDAFVRSNRKHKIYQLMCEMIERGDCAVIFYNTAMKAGEFPWAMGCFAAILSEGENPTTHTRSTLKTLARDAISNKILEEMNNCDWKISKLLNSEMLVNPPNNTTPSLLDTLKLMLREIQCSREVIDRKTTQLRETIIRMQALSKSE